RLPEQTHTLLDALGADRLRDQVLEAVPDHGAHLLESEGGQSESGPDVIEALGDGLVAIDQRAVEVEDDAANQLLDPQVGPIRATRSFSRISRQDAIDGRRKRMLEFAPHGE